MSREIREGDRVRFTGTASHEDIANGGIYTVQSIINSGGHDYVCYMQDNSYNERLSDFELVEDRPTRAFRVGDRIKCASVAPNYGSDPVIGQVYEVCGIELAFDWVRVIYGERTMRFLSRDFELVEREYSIETLIKRANLGLKAMHELQSKYPSEAGITFESGKVSFSNGIAFCYDDSDAENPPTIVKLLF